MKKSPLNKDYETLSTLSREGHVLRGATRLLEWDQETYMPPGAAASRAEQLSLLAGLVHERFTGKKFSDALGRLIDLKKGTLKVKGLGTEKEAALREWRKDFIKATAIPTSFVKDFAKLTSEALGAWREAKEKSQFSIFAPFLRKLVKMSEKKAELLGYEEVPYDALLDEYEPGVTTKQVTVLFGKLAESIRKLLKEIAKKKQVDNAFLMGSFDQEKLMAFSHQVLKSMGYDFNHGRLDLSSHPFSTSFHPTDSRVTTRFGSENLIDAISAVIHEGGHSLYEMGLPHETFGSPLSEAVSMGMHESQSRFWETRIGQSKAFWGHFLPLLKQSFPKQLGQITLDRFYQGINKVQPSLTRVEADEVTYPLHVILRFEIERGLFDGSIEVEEIPEIWNQKMKEYFGVVPANDREGCLQDIHWSMGAFGYFPSYTLGNLYAAHIFEGFEKAHPDWAKKVEAGDLLFIRKWLKEAVHQHGRRYSSQELLKKINPKAFSPQPYLNYLQEKYHALYK